MKELSTIRLNPSTNYFVGRYVAGSMMLPMIPISLVALALPAKGKAVAE